MSITPFSTITLRASPDGDTQVFIDNDSVQANSIRAYNTSTIEAFLSVGDIVDFPLPPHDSIVLHKEEGDGKLFAKTESGSAIIRCTAIQEKNSDGDSMGILNVIPILKDALGNQSLIDKAAKKISDANKISAANKKESEDAARIIEEAKSATERLYREKNQHQTNVSAHNDYVNKKTAEFESAQNEINKKKSELEKTHKEYSDALSFSHAKLEESQRNLDARELELQERSKKISEDKRNNDAIKVANEVEAKRLLDLNASLIKEKEKFEARKKKITDAAKEE